MPAIRFPPLDFAALSHIVFMDKKEKETTRDSNVLSLINSRLGKGSLTR
jgi:hypothetical protein